MYKLKRKPFEKTKLDEELNPLDKVFTVRITPDDRDWFFIVFLKGLFETFFDLGCLNNMPRFNTAGTNHHLFNPSFV